MAQWAREQAQREIAYIESRERRIRQDVERAIQLYEESPEQDEDETSGKNFNIEILFTEIPTRTVEFLDTIEKDDQFFKGVQPVQQVNGTILKEGEQGWMEYSVTSFQN